MKVPDNDYDFEEKRKYRETVWKYFSQHLSPSQAVVALMPSKNGEEIITALNFGFKEENLIAIDDNPAAIATSNWRKKFPKVKFYGNKLSRAGERMKSDGIVLDAINMDLCNNLSFELFEEVSEFIKSGCLSSESLVSITVLRGREPSIVNVISTLYTDHINGDISEAIGKRVGILLNILLKMAPISIEPLYADTYISGKKSMRYAIIKICTSGWHKDKTIEEIDYLYNMYMQKVVYYHKCLKFCLDKLSEDWNSLYLTNFKYTDGPEYLSFDRKFDGRLKKRGAKKVFKELNAIYCFWREYIIMYNYLYHQALIDAKIAFEKYYEASFEKKYVANWHPKYKWFLCNNKKGQIINRELGLGHWRIDGRKNLLNRLINWWDNNKGGTNADWSLEEHGSLDVPFEFFISDPEA